MLRERYTDCRRCDNRFDPDRDVKPVVNPLRCPKCGQVHYEEETRTKTITQSESESFEGQTIDSDVYAIASDSGHVKIGISVEPERRLRDIQTSVPYELELLATATPADAADIESRLHDRFAEYQSSGEWFDLPEQKREALVAELSEW